MYTAHVHFFYEFRPFFYRYCARYLSKNTVVDFGDWCEDIRLNDGPDYFLIWPCFYYAILWYARSHWARLSFCSGTECTKIWPENAGMFVSAVRNLVKNICGEWISCFGRSTGVRGGTVCWGTTLQARRLRVRFLMLSLEFFIDIILPAAL